MTTASDVQRRSRELKDWLHPVNIEKLRDSCRDAIVTKTEITLNPRYLLDILNKLGELTEQ